MLLCASCPTTHHYRKGGSDLETKTAKNFKRSFFSKSFYYDVTLLKKLAKRVLENLVPLNPNDRNCDNTI